MLTCNLHLYETVWSDECPINRKLTITCSSPWQALCCPSLHFDSDVIIEECSFLIKWDLDFIFLWNNFLLPLAPFSDERSKRVINLLRLCVKKHKALSSIHCQKNIQLLEYPIPPPPLWQKIRMAISRERKELSEIRWCQNEKILNPQILGLVGVFKKSMRPEGPPTRSRGPECS